MCPICGKQEDKKKKQKSRSLLIQNQELLRLRLTHEEKVFYTELYYDNAVSGKVTRNNFLPLLGMLGTQIAEEFADRIFMTFSSNKEDITLCEYLRYIDIYHYGDDRERCRVTCKLIDKKSSGYITFEDFKSYITLIINAVKKVNGGQSNILLSDVEVKDLFFHISKNQEKFSYQDFEDIYKEKPELVSWFDYFKNNKEDLLLVIDENVKILLDKINGFLSYFMEDLFKVLDHEEEIDLERIIQKVFDYSKEFEILRQNFLQKISAFNIRSTFDKLQHNNKDEKTTDLINALKKKIFSDEQNFTHEYSSFNEASDITNGNFDSKFSNREKKHDSDPISKNNQNNNFDPVQIQIKIQNTDGTLLNQNIASTGSKKFYNNKNKDNKLNIPENRIKKSSFEIFAHNSNKQLENANIDKFFGDIKNKITTVRSMNKDKQNYDSKLSANYEDLLNNNNIVNSFSEFDKEKNINNQLLKDSKKISLEGSKISKNTSNPISAALSGNKFLSIRNTESDFMKNFMKQKTLFDNKMFRFGSDRGSNVNESGAEDQSIKIKNIFPVKPKRKSYEMIENNNIIKDEIIENVDEEEYDEDYIKAKSTIKYLRKSSQFANKPCKRVLSYVFEKQDSEPKNIIINAIKQKNMTLTLRDTELKNGTTQLIKGTNFPALIDEEENSLIYDKSDYDKTIVNDGIDDDLYHSNDHIQMIKKNKFSSKSLMSSSVNQFKINAQYKVIHTNKKMSTSKIIFANEENPRRTKTKLMVNKYIKKINNLEKESSGLKQLLFCARVVLENANDVCQTFSRCYKWIGENYLESQIKKVQKEIKLKEKQKKDKEKYGKMGNMPKKVVPSKKKIIRASDQSFKLLLNMIMGIQIAVQSIQNFHIKLTEDLNKYLTNMLYSIQTINFGKKAEEVFVLKEFAGVIFNNIRLYLGYDKDDFISSISPQDFITELMISNQTIFEELCSTGKSGSLFYYTRDGQFIVKTIKRQEYKFLKQILQDYFKHLKQNPLSLLPKFLGCYVLIRKVKKKRSKIYFIVMVNVFATSKRIHIRYDLKGSRVGRRVLTGKKSDEDILAKGDLALKDLDFEKLNQKVFVGDKREIIVKQIKSDADFLCKIGANDYSLLLGIHNINKEKSAMSNSILEGSTNFANTNIYNNTIINQENDSILSNESANERFKKLEKIIDFDDGGIISETREEIYFLGIIDILTKYNWVKKVEHFSKMIRYCSNEMSCTPPDQYRDRFVRYMNGVIKKKKNSVIKYKNNTQNLIGNLNKFNNVSNLNNTSNIILQNNTNNIFNIVNNNNTINLNPIDDKNEIDTSYKLKNDKIMITSKYNTEDIIKEESIDTGQDNEKSSPKKSSQINVNINNNI